MGHMFRKSGAFFIRRSFKRAKLYLLVFNRYIQTLLEEGHPIEFFIEGGRSRNGKLGSPKTGFLSILLQAFQEGCCKDLIFVPTSVVYDRIIEEKSYLKELSGAQKKTENMGQIIQARRFLKRNYGKIYIRFSEPFSLNEYISNKDLSRKETHRDLAFHLIKSINDVSLVTPLSLVATAILANHRRGFYLSDLTETVEILLAFLENDNRPYAKALHHPKKAVKETLSLLIDWNVVEFSEKMEGEEDIFYNVEEDKKLKLEYYKNNIIHFFINQAFIAVSLMSGTEEVKDRVSIISDYQFLTEIFKNEFVFDKEEDLTQKITSLIDYFQEASFLSCSGENAGYSLTKLGFAKLPIWASLPKTFIESYWVAFKTIAQQKGLPKGKKENLLKNIDSMGMQFHKLGVIDHIGALSLLNFKNALNFSKEILPPMDADSKEKDAAIEKLSLMGHRLYEMSHPEHGRRETG